jgi:hypothetical protein
LIKCVEKEIDKEVPGNENKIECSITRSAVLTHYHSSVYPSYEAYRQGLGLLSDTSMPADPTVDVNLLIQDIKRTHPLH